MTKSATWFSQYLTREELGNSSAGNGFAPERIPHQSVSTFPKRKKKITNLFEQKLIKLQNAREVVLSKSPAQARELLFHYLTARGNNILNLNSHLLDQEKEKWENRGITIRHIEHFEANEIEKNIDDKTSFIYLETINEQTLHIASLLKVYVIAREHGIPVVTDNSNGHLGALVRPTNYGVNVVLEDASALWNSPQQEFTTLITEGKSFPWDKIRHPRLVEAYQKKKENLPEHARADFSLLEILLEEKKNEVQEIPPELSAFADEKIERLQKQVAEDSKHALHLAEYLYQVQFIRFVHYAGLKSSDHHFSALTYLRNGFGNELAFETNSSELDRAVQHIFSSSQHQFTYRFNPETHWHHLKIKGASAQYLLQLFHQVSEEWIEHSKSSGLLPWNLDYSI